MTARAISLGTDIVLLLDQPLGKRPDQRLTVTASFCRFYRRGWVDVYLPPSVQRELNQQGGERFRASQPFENTSVTDLKAGAHELFNRLLEQLQQQRHYQGKLHGQLHFEL